MTTYDIFRKREAIPSKDPILSIISCCLVNLNILSSMIFDIELFLLECLNVEVPADICCDFIALYLAANDVRILAGGETEIVLGGDDGGE